MSDNTSQFGEVIYSYSRAQAIQDGVLVDLTQFPITRNHWKFHVACTASVWASIQTPVRSRYADYVGILQDIFSNAKSEIRKGTCQDTVRFQVLIGGESKSLKMHIGPGDDPTPVITLMLPSED